MGELRAAVVGELLERGKRSAVTRQCASVNIGGIARGWTRVAVPGRRLQERRGVAKRAAEHSASTAGSHVKDVVVTTATLYCTAPL